MPEMPQNDYNVLDEYVRTVLYRCSAGICDPATGHADLMYPLTAWDKGNKQEFIPYMATMLAKWKKE